MIFNKRKGGHFYFTIYYLFKLVPSRNTQKLTTIRYPNPFHEILTLNAFVCFPMVTLNKGYMRDTSSEQFSLVAAICATPIEAVARSI